MDINFELYKIFYLAAKEESFSKAAECLYISQSAVSQAIRNLENSMGVKLFYRKSRTTRLTAEGEMLYRHISQAYQWIRTGETRVQEMQDLSWGEIRLGVGDTICKHYMIPYIRKFIAVNPRIRLQVSNRTSVQILHLLGQQQCDIGIVTLPIEENDIDITNFLEVQDIFVTTSKYPELLQQKISLEKLTEYPLLLLEANSTTRINLDRHLAAKGLQIHPEIELESVDLLIEFAKLGMGVAHAMRASAQQALTAGELFEVQLIDPLPPRKLGIATVKGVPLSPASQEFIRYLVAKEGE